MFIKRTERKGSSPGFTLTELLVAMTIATVVMAAIYSSYYSQQKAYTVTETMVETQQNLRAAMYQLERDIRMAGFDPKGAKQFGFTTMDSDEIGFSIDGDENGIAGVTEFYRYKVDTAKNTFQRGIGSSGSPPTAYTDSDIAENITTADFQYLDSSGVTTATASSVRIVEVTLTANQDGHSRQWNTRIQCRNLGT